MFRALIIFFTFLFIKTSEAQELYPVKLSDKPWHGESLELRYKPEGTDFVIKNGNRQFTRALYGTHTAFRVETGDRPEFALYMPGMGGNFRVGIAVGQKSKWLTTADEIISRYRPGARIYDIRDSLLGNGNLHIEILALADAEGFIIKASAKNISTPFNFFWAFGGASGKKFSRDGDMGPDPESSFYLKPENCRDNYFDISAKNSFHLRYGTGIPVFDTTTKTPGKEQFLDGVFPQEAELKIADATKLSSPLELYNSQVEKSPVLIGRITIISDSEHYFSIGNPVSKPLPLYQELASVFDLAEKAREKLATRIQINTPDSFINTIGGALSVAADALWEAPTYMHGSIGWRMRLPGWRGPYVADVLGWHDRAKTNLNAYALSQFTSPLTAPVIPDTAMQLARSSEKMGVGMFSSGYIARDPNGINLRPHHYDMNLVYIDQLLRHFAWTGDTAFVRNTWQLIKRHLNWETRNFDADSNNLFDAYAVIWASDALQYSGGDVAHSSAYNYFHFKKAGEIAFLLGENPEPYKLKAAKILAAMNSKLWLPGKGIYAEYKDALGNKLLHSSPALWTIYHSIDSEVPDKFQAYQMLRYVDIEIPHVPVRAQGLDDSSLYTLSTTSWMPYMWSLNNVALAESMHTALANWQSGRSDEGFKLFKSEVLQSMYLGGSPGNIVQISHFDAVRGEAYRDFGDPVGMFSRALTEGLFGINPDVLHSKLVIRPGLPVDWEYASFSTPDISFDFKRKQNSDEYLVINTMDKNLRLILQVPVRGEIEKILVNGKSQGWKNLDAVGIPRVEINGNSSKKYAVVIVWKKRFKTSSLPEKTYVHRSEFRQTFTDAVLLKIFDPQKTLTDVKKTKSAFTAKVNVAEGNHTVFAQLQRGKLTWWRPICFRVAPAFEIIPATTAEDNMNQFYVRNNTGKASGFTLNINDFSMNEFAEAGQVSPLLSFPDSDFVAGTNRAMITNYAKDSKETQIINWNGKFKGKQETLDLTGYFNDKVTQIFRNKYLSPRPQATTLQLPWQGIGDWPHPLEEFDVNDSGLRKAAGVKNEINLPQGIRLSTPSNPAANNILFTSQWDNYPQEKTIPLSGNSSHMWLLLAGSTNPMQSQLTNGEIVVQYTDGTQSVLELRNPDSWWPIDQDYYTDGFAFALKKPRPPRVHLQTGKIVSGELSKANFNGKKISGGAATVLDLVLYETKTLKSFTLRTLANDVVIGLMAVTLQR